MLFCPTCANLLVISTETGYNKWACNSCAYEFPITKQVSR
jgi:DNA-directed RNA polymerase III subunit RPC11